MFWGKRKPIAADDTRLRCQFETRRNRRLGTCGRLAKKYNLFINGSSLGQVNYCNRHLEKVTRNLLVAAERVDGRKRVEAVQL